MALRTEQKLPLILSVVFVTLTTFGILFYQSTESLRKAIELDRRSTAFVDRLDAIQAMCFDAESSVRYFMFTGSDTYLEPYNRAKTRIPQYIAELRGTGTDVPDALAQLDQLAAAYGNFIGEMERKVNRRKMVGYQGALGDVYAEGDRERIDAIRGITFTLKAAELKSQQSRDLRMDEGLSNTVWILIVSSFAGVAAIGLANFVVHREISRRRGAEDALTDANRDLEEKIALRTEELQVTNRQLVDIGEERERLLETESRSRREAEIANRLRDEFMASVSHELRTPLNSILGWARLLKDGSLSIEQSERALTTIIKNSETQNRLIEDLLDVARLISGKLELDRERLNLVDAVAESIEISGPAARAKRLRVHFDRGATRPNVFGDRNRLRQVFSNLMNNAIKFSLEGGDLFVSIATANGEVDIRFRDEGIGISKDFLPLVFERFRQDASAEKGNSGLGLGLAIVRNLVELHGGRVAAKSEGTGKGAEFTVTLPAIQD